MSLKSKKFVVGSFCIFFYVLKQIEFLYYIAFLRYNMRVVSSESFLTSVLSLPWRGKTHLQNHVKSMSLVRNDAAKNVSRAGGLNSALENDSINSLFIDDVLKKTFLGEKPE